MSRRHSEHRFEDDDDEDDEFWEFLALILLVLIPIVLIYGLCVFCYKQRKLALKKSTARSK